MLCPICQKPVGKDDPFMPFCSDRCRIIDLGNWASEKYAIPAPFDENDAENDAAHDAPDPGDIE